MKKQLAIAAALMAAGSASMALDYYSSSANVVLTGSNMMTEYNAGQGSMTSGTSWTLNVNGGEWNEYGAYYVFKAPAGTTVKLNGTTSGVTSNLPSTGVVYCDVSVFAMRVDPTSPIAGQTAGPVPGHPTTVMPYMTDTMLSGYTGTSSAQAYADGYQYFDYSGTYGSYIEAILNYGANVQNFNAGGVDISEKGVYASWNEQTGQPGAGSFLSDVTYNGIGLGRVLCDQVGTFDGVVTTTGTGDYYFVVGMKAGHGAAAAGSVSFSNLNISIIPEPASLGLLALGAVAFLGRRRK